LPRIQILREPRVDLREVPAAVLSFEDPVPLIGKRDEARGDVLPLLQLERGA
jgi:hypothetical protein